MLDNIEKFINEDQDPKTVEKIIDKVKDILTQDEVPDYISVQKKPAINISPDSVVLTNKRVIFCRPKNLGLSMDFEDYFWMDVEQSHIKEGIIGSTFKIKTTKGAYTELDYLPKNQARKLYQFAQAKEEEMIEFRRQRELEDKRAAAGGGIVVNTGNTPPSGNPVSEEKTESKPAYEDPVVVLQKLKVLLDEGIISWDEFNAKKNEVISRM